MSTSATPPDAGRRIRWVELSAALTAVVASIGSLLIARHQAVVMDRQLAAQVWPLVEFGTSNLTEDGKPQLSLDLSNVGVGPTRVRSALLPDTSQRALYRAFERERFRVAARVCYCSVLEECWVMASADSGGDPHHVDSCAEERKALQYR